MSDRLDTALQCAIDAALAAGASDAEASYCGTETQFTRFASSRFTQVGRTWSDALRIRVLIDGRLGTQVCASLVDKQVRTSAIAAVQAAKLSPKLDVALTFNAAEPDAAAPDAAVPDAAAPDAAEPDAAVPDAAVPSQVALPESVTAARAPQQLADAFAANNADGVQFAGSVKAYRQVLAVRTAGNLARRFQHTFADAQLIALLDDASGFAGWCGTPNNNIDLGGLAGVAADKARASRDAIEIEPGAYDVVLAPEAVAELLEWMAAASFSADTVLDGTSLLAGRQGQQLCDQRITLTDEPSDGELRFDAEGTLRRKVTFIDAGTAGTVVSDLVSAARLGNGAESTGHAPNVADAEAMNPSVVHLRLAPGDQTEAELIAAVDRGLYITRFHYVNGLLDTRRATMTGMTRDGTFLIEKGALGRGVRNMRFTQPMLEAFSRVGGIGASVKDIPSWWSQGGVVSTPAMLLRAFEFTGNSK